MKFIISSRPVSLLVCKTKGEEDTVQPLPFPLTETVIGLAQRRQIQFHTGYFPPSKLSKFDRYDIFLSHFFLLVCKPNRTFPLFAVFSCWRVSLSAASWILMSVSSGSAWKARWLQMVLGFKKKNEVRCVKVTTRFPFSVTLQTKELFVHSQSMGVLLYFHFRVIRCGC